jgi:hypothetical protein
MFGIKRYVGATVGLALMALPATALASDHHWNHHWDHHWARAHRGYVTPPVNYPFTRNYVVPRPGILGPYAYSGTPYVAPRYASQGNPYVGPYASTTPFVGPFASTTPYVGPYAGAGAGNLSYMMQKRQQALNAIAAANRSGNRAGAHRMWEVYNSYNQRIAAAGGGALRY